MPLTFDSSVCDSGDVRLIRVSDATGEMEQTEVAVGGLEQSMLDSDDVFIVDLFTEVFVWVGKGATAAERQESMRAGTSYCSEEGRPPWTRVTKVRRYIPCRLLTMTCRFIWSWKGLGPPIHPSLAVTYQYAPLCTVTHRHAP